MNSTILWRGYHSLEVQDLVARAWSREDTLLILCPPTLSRFEMAAFLPHGSVQYSGAWDETPELVAGGQTFPDRPVLGLMTSGTTAGESKLVFYSKRNIRASLSGVLQFYDERRLDGIFCYPQPFHTFGLLLGYVLGLEKGLPLHRGEGRYSLDHHRRWLDFQSPGLMTLGTPTHFQDLLSYVEAANISVSPTYTCVVGGASVSMDLWQRLQNRLRIEAPSIGYGATEASPGVMHQFAGVPPKEDGEIGLPLPGVQVSVQSDGYNMKGPSVCMAMAFQDRIEFPKEVFIKDQIEQRPDGVFLFRGRSEALLNRGGEKFSFDTIERILKDRLGLEVLAFAVPDPRLSWELGLLIQSSDRQEGLVATAQACLQEVMKANFSSSYFRTVTSFPYNQNQKPDRKQALAEILAPIKSLPELES